MCIFLYCLFVSISQVIGCEDRLRNDMYCVEWGIKLYSNQPAIHLRNDDLLYYTFITLSAGERIFKIGEHLAKLQAKMVIVSCAPFTLHFVLRDADLAR